MHRSALFLYAVLAACLSVILVVSPAAGQCAGGVLLNPSNSSSFGINVASNGGVLVVGSPSDVNEGNMTGAAYIYRSTTAGWVEEIKLLALDGAAGDQFGWYVAIDGDLVAIGAVDNSENGLDAGAVYLFRYNGVTWIQEAKLLASNGMPGNTFGRAIAVSGNVVVVGVRRRETAYIYTFDGANWNEEAILQASEGKAGDHFGVSVAIDGDVAFIGASGDDDLGQDAGAVYVFQYDGVNWNEQAKLVANDAVPDASFGLRVATDQGRLLVLGGSLNSGYIFAFDGLDWSQETKLIPSPDAAAFGKPWSVDLVGDTVAIGSWLGELVYIFRRDVDGWSHLKTIAPNEQYSSWFLSVAVIDHRVAVGDYLNQNVTVHARIGESDCNFNGFGDTCEIANGLVFDCNFNGIPDECENDCNNNGIPDDCDIADGTSIDCNADGIPDECVNDCNDNGIDDSCDIDASTSMDCNRNGVPDECDVAGATSFDCDGNGIPDECETDCNENGIGDACDISSGTSFDLNLNDVPDECERANCPAEFKVIAADGDPGDRFGESVAINGDVAVIGADRDDENGEDAGAAYIFRRSGNDWLQEAKLLASDGVASYRYGISVAVGNDVAMIGAPLLRSPSNSPGLVYIYRHNPISGEWDEEVILQPSHPIPGVSTWFGGYMALDNDVLAVSSSWLAESGDKSIVANIYRYDPLASAWVEEAILPISRIPYPGFWIPTNAMSMSNGVIVGGEPGFITTPDVRNPGTAFVYRYDAATSVWVSEGTLNASDPDPLDFFGIATAVHGDVIVVGAPLNDDLGENSGSAYVYRYDSIAGIWAEEAKLLAPDGQAGDIFGAPVGIENDIILVGAMKADGGVSDSGGVYRFRFDATTSTWIPQGMIHARFPATGDSFGRDMAISDGRALISAPFDDIIFLNSGAAYFYEDIRQFCPAPGDINADGRVNVFDLLAILSAWGDCLPPPPPEAPCPADLNHDGRINVTDLLTLLANWG